MITNEVINKDIKKTNNKIWISLLVIILGIGLFFFGEYFDKKLKKDAQNLNDVIESKREDKENIYTYLDVKNTALLFAGFDDKKEYYYFVTDGTYVYIAYMDEATYKENFENDGKDNIRIYGYTYTTTKDVKQIAIDTYNEMYELKGDEALTVADFSNYFVPPTASRSGHRPLHLRPHPLCPWTGNRSGSSCRFCDLADGKLADRWAKSAYPVRPIPGPVCPLVWHRRCHSDGVYPGLSCQRDRLSADSDELSAKLGAGGK